MIPQRHRRMDGQLALALPHSAHYHTLHAITQ